MKYLVLISSWFTGNINLEQDSDEWIVPLNVFCSELLEEGSWGLRKKTNQMEKSVSWGPLCPVHAQIAHTKKHTFRHALGPYALAVVRPVVCPHHVRVLACSLPSGDKKRSLLCVDNCSSHPLPGPSGPLFRGADKQNYKHSLMHAHTQTHTLL